MRYHVLLVMTILPPIMIALIAVAQPTVVNGGFEMPTIAEMVRQGSPGDGVNWAANFDIPGWIDSSWSGYNRCMIIDGNQNFYWNDPVGAFLEQTLTEPVTNEIGTQYTLVYWRRITRSVAAIAEGKTIEFRAELIIGGEIVDSEHITDEAPTAVRMLSYTSDGNHIGDLITIRFKATSNKGWTNDKEIQSVFLDAVSMNVAPMPGFGFGALGLTEPLVPPPEGPTVTVYFPDPSYHMHFDPPYEAAYYTEDGIGFGNEWAETSYEGSCYEVGFDTNATMWIEHQNPARIVVCFRGALVNPEGKTAHTEVESRSPYGPGDWADEWFYIYPDGLSVRTVKIYTGRAHDAVAFWGRPGTVFETQETFIYGHVPGHQPSDDISDNALTLIRMTGESKQISYRPYPPDIDLFQGANIQMVNLRSDYHPFTIVPKGDVDVKPYYGPPIDQQHVDQTVFVSWPRVPYFESGYVSALTHVINWSWYERTDRTLVQVYLLGLTKEPTEHERVTKLVDLARSWQDAPELTPYGKGYSYEGFAVMQKAYILSVSTPSPSEIQFTVEANPDRPLVNPCFVIENWGSDAPVDVAVNGRSISRESYLRQGTEQDKFGKPSKVIWLDLQAKTPVEFLIRK